MLKLVGKCSGNNGGINTSLFIHRLRRSLFQFSTSSSSTSTKRQQEEHPSSSVPKFLVENLGFSQQQSLSISSKISAGWQADAGQTRVSSKINGLSPKLDQSILLNFGLSNVPTEARKGNPPMMPAVTTLGGPLDLSSVLFRNPIIFSGGAAGHIPACNSGNH